MYSLGLLLLLSVCALFLHIPPFLFSGHGSSPLPFPAHWRVVHLHMALSITARGCGTLSLTFHMVSKGCGFFTRGCGLTCVSKGRGLAIRYSFFTLVPKGRGLAIGYSFFTLAPKGCGLTIGYSFSTLAPKGCGLLLTRGCGTPLGLLWWDDGGRVV